MECAWADASFFGWITQTRHHVTYPVQRCFPPKIDAYLIHLLNKPFVAIGTYVKLLLSIMNIGYDDDNIITC